MAAAAGAPFFNDSGTNPKATLEQKKKHYVVQLFSKLTDASQATEKQIKQVTIKIQHFMLFNIQQAMHFVA